MAVDKGTLQAIAQRTGGRFWMAEDENSLRRIYEEIDKLERSDVEAIKYVDYKELFAPFALAALVVLFLEVLLTCTLLRKMP